MSIWWSLMMVPECSWKATKVSWRPYLLMKVLCKSFVACKGCFIDSCQIKNLYYYLAVDKLQWTKLINFSNNISLIFQGWINVRRLPNSQTVLNIRLNLYCMVVLWQKISKSYVSSWRLKKNLLGNFSRTFPWRSSRIFPQKYSRKFSGMSSGLLPKAASRP